MPITKKKKKIPSQNKTKEGTTSKTNHTLQVNETNEQKAKAQADPLQSPSTNKTTEQSPELQTTQKPFPFPLLLILFTVLLISVGGIIFQPTGLLPSEFTGIASGLVVLIGIIFTFWQIGGTELLVRLLKAFWLRPVMWVSLAIAVLVLASTMILPQYFYRHYYTFQPVPTYQPDTPTPIPPLLSLPSVKWTQLLSQEAPDCNNNNVQWYEYLGKTFLSCDGHNLVMQDKDSINNPEIYLESIRGKLYDQRNFRVTVQVFFKDKSLTSTSAEVAVQTSERNASSGGYFFFLKPTGNWMLCLGFCDYSYQALRIGRVYPDMTRPVEMTLEAYKGHLFALINQTEVASIDDAPSSTARYIGLRVSQDFDTQTSLSPIVLFSNFKLDVPG